MLSVDGGRDCGVALTDIGLMRALVKPSHVALLDDSEMPGVRRAMLRCLEIGTIDVDDEMNIVWRK